MNSVLINLALDISRSKTGAAWGGNDGPPRSSSFRAPPGVQGETGKGIAFGPAGAAYQAWLADLLAVVQPARVCLEAPMQVIRGPKATALNTSQETIECLFGLAFLTETTVYQHATRSSRTIACYKLHAGTGRKAFVGSGHAEKADVMAQCRRIGWSPANLDESDAMCVLYSMLVLDKNWRPAVPRRAGALL